MGRYPTRRNGDEYYPKDYKSFLKDRRGKELYARNRHGSQLYPKRNKNMFARNEKGFEYYAKTNKADEFYPLVNGRSIFITDPTTFQVKVARMADGTERYPKDGKGHEYYLRNEGIPFVLKKSDGETYLARNRRGDSLIPWNYFKEFIPDNVPHTPHMDAGGNVVYSNQENVSKLTNLLIKCLCEILVVCPGVAATTVWCM